MYETKERREDELESLIEKENKLDSIKINNNKENNKISLDLFNPTKTKGIITKVKDTGENIALEIAYNNTKFCNKLKIPNKNKVDKDNYPIFDLLKYYDIPNGKFLNLEGKEVYIIESRFDNSIESYELSLPSKVNRKSKKIFSMIQLLREKGVLNLYNVENETKIKIEPVILFPILVFVFTLSYLLKFIFSHGAEIVSDTAFHVLMTLSTISGIIMLISGFYFCVLLFFLGLHIIDKMYEKYIIKSVERYWPFN